MSPLTIVEYDYFSGKEAHDRKLIKLPTDEYFNDGAYITTGWYPVTVLDVRGDMVPFSEKLNYRRPIQNAS